MHVALNAQLLAGQASYRSAGIHHYIDHLLRHLPQAAPELRLTIFTGAGQTAVTGASVRRTRLPTGRPVVRIIWEQVLQPLILARLRPDLLHSLAFVSPVLAAPPTVVTVYDLSFKLMPQRFRPAQRLYLNALTAYSCRRARRVIAISESTRADLQRYFGLARERIDVAYPGIAPAFRPLPAAVVEDFRARQGLPERFILYLGTLEPRKNLTTLAQAFATLRASQPDLFLVLAGARGWWYQDLLRQVERLGLAEAVIFPGYVPDEDLPLWYNAAAAFAYPSSYEGFGLPVAEALACGRPVVTSTAASMPEAAGEAALLAPPDDAGAWAAALERALRLTPEELALGPAHAARFTWTATAAQTAASYRRALHLAPASAPAAAPRQVQGS
jgi:glycosyltransferase involved in cell wall biosynthesis